MPVAGGAVRQEVEEDADDDLPNAGMDTPVKVRKFQNNFDYQTYVLDVSYPDFL